MSSLPHPQTDVSSARGRLKRRMERVLTVVSAVAVVFMLNYLSGRHFRRFHLSSTGGHQLTAMTVQVLNTLTNRVRLVALFRKDATMFGAVSGLLNEYAQASRMVKVEYVDYRYQPSAAEQARKKFNLNLDDESNLVVVECAGRVRVCAEKELSELDLSELVKGQSKEVRRIGFKGEQVFTSAIFSVAAGRSLKAYFLTGHGEYDPANERERGYSQFARQLSALNVQWERLNLARTDVIPADCQLLIASGPRDRFLEQDAAPGELEKLDRYLNQGGRFLALLNRETQTGLENYLGKWGADVGRNLVLDDDNSSGGLLVATNFSGHPLTRPLIQSRIVSGLPRSVERRGAAKQDADAPQVEPLIMTGVKGRVVTDLRTDGAYYTSPRDRQGEVPFMVAIEKGTLKGVSADRGSTRILVIGDGLLLTNQMLDNFQGNQQLASLMINWLLDRYQLLAIGPAPVKEYRLLMTPSQLATARVVLLAGLPGGVLLIGVLVWIRRRN